MLSETNCLIAQSGGPTAVINASLAGLIETALASDRITNIYGSVNGILGVLEERFLNLTEIFKEKHESIDQLKHTPAMYLGSCRYKLSNPEDPDGDYVNIFRILKKHNIKYFFYIGGNDSMDTVAKLSEYSKRLNYDINFIGIPKTIDNDLECIDHTPGYGSAAKYIASSVLEVAHDTYIYDTESVTILEIMGRNAGWLTAAAALARNTYNTAPHLIYLPECSFSTSQFIKDIKTQFEQRKHIIIAVSEGVKDPAGNYICAEAGNTDKFGHVMLNGTGKYLENLVRATIGCKVRSIELNILQRCSAHLSSKTDMDEAFLLGREGMKAALSGESGKMSALKRITDSPYAVEYCLSPISKVANYEKKIPREWINEQGNDIKEELLNYMSPLIQGESEHCYKDGIPVYLSVEHLIRGKEA